MSAHRAPRTGRLARSVIAGGAMARLGLAQWEHKLRTAGQDLTLGDASRQDPLREHEHRLGRILFAALNQLKGTALKASQLLSMELGLLPEGLRAELAKAHHQVTPLNRALVIKQLRQAFGAGPEDLFAHFEPHAFAAASLGQVHAATLKDGRAVAVKLQYPGMADTIRSDLDLLRRMLQVLGDGAAPRPEVLTQVLTDIQHTLSQELDYQLEARTLTWFGEQLQHRTDLLLPQPVSTLCSARVLTMTHVPGLHLNEWLATRPSQTERDRQGQRLFDLFMHSSFELRRLQADPHPGNFLFLPDGRLGLLDFGCTRELPAQFSEALAAAWCALLRQPCDTEGLRQAYVALGLITPGLDPAQFARQLLPALAPVIHWQVSPFRETRFDFGQLPPPPRPDPEHHRLALAYLRHMAPELPFFDRAYLGLVQLLRQLGARVRTSNPWVHP